MNKKYYIMVLVALVVLPIAFFGCKSKTEEPKTEEAANMATEAVSGPMSEPAQTVATETIPPTAEPQVVEKASVATDELSKNQDIQKALKNAGFYTGAVDGKIGPKTKNAIVEFQKAKGLKADGKVGPKTWTELSKHLTQ